MDFTKLPRELIYKDRLSLEEFDITNERWLNKAIFEQLASMPGIDHDNEDTEALFLAVFNDSYYILTLVLQESIPLFRYSTIRKIMLGNSFYIAQFRKECITMSFVLTLLDIYVNKWNPHTKMFREQLEEALSENVFRTVNEFKINISQFRPVAMTYRFYEPRIISEDVANSMNWSKLTDNYNESRIKEIVKNIGSTSDEKMNVVSAIYNSLSESPDLSKIPYTTDKLLDDLYKELNMNNVGILGSKGSRRESIILGSLTKAEMSQYLLKHPHLANNVDELFEEDNQIDRVNEENEKLKTECAQLIKKNEQQNELIKRLNHELQELRGMNSLETHIVIAEDRKIDVIKILHSMCKTGLFKKKDETNINVQRLMEIFGRILNNNFSDYSSNLSASKAKTKEKTFLAIFDELKESERKYFNKS